MAFSGTVSSKAEGWLSCLGNLGSQLHRRRWHSAVYMVLHELLIDRASEVPGDCNCDDWDILV